MRLLVVDDDVLVRQSIQLGLGDQYKLLLASSFNEARVFLENEELDGAIIDINLGSSGPSGIDFLLLFKKKYPEKPAIIESGDRDLSTVVKCIKLGADDYLEKPFDKATLQLKLSKAFGDVRKNRVFKRAFEKSQAVHQIVGTSEKLQRAKTTVEHAGNLRMLFYGETGVGKTPFALYSNQIVSQMEGQVRPFEQINCACLNNEQFQDQLFGHKKGAFTGAISDKRGLVELAQGGDLFLDEIGDMPLETQAHFLTFLDSMEYYRLGDDRKRQAEVRVISATNKNLKKMVEEGKFRKDLYSRIAQVIVDIPTLRERVSDIPTMVEHFIRRFVGFDKKIDPKILELFQGYRWEEGNVRELRDTVEYLCTMARDSDQIGLEHLSDRYKPLSENLEINESVGDEDLEVLSAHGLETYLSQVEKTILQNYIQRHPGSMEDLAGKLKVSKPTLYRRLKKYNISSDDMPELN